jgi:energy-coupling factor transporter ATP-binding protein EcfA2
MRIRDVQIHNFRRVRELNWSPTGDLVCLIGAGDAGKTTLLDAIEWCLWPRYTLQVSDADFTDLSVEAELRIEVTVADVPDHLLARSGFDTHQRFLAADGSLHDEPPDDTAEPVLTICLTVDEGLDPNWQVVCGDRQEPRPIGARQRASLGVARLGGNPDRDLRWGRGSALARLTDDPGDSNRALAAAYRAARNHLSTDDLADLDGVLGVACAVAPAYGAAVAEEGLAAALDPAALTPNTSALGLQAAGVPLTSHGLATRRLLSLALQGRAVLGGAIVLIDEVEHGLEPHRLRHLLSVLGSTVGSDEPHAPGQIFMTTHAPTALVELSADQLHVVRATDGSGTVVHNLTDSIQGLVRAQPEALLAPSVIVAEGATEYGLLRGLDRTWSSADDASPFAHHGVALADGGGSRAAGRARDLADAGFRVALLCDSDTSISPTAAELAAVGVTVIQWADDMKTEERLASDLPMPTLVDLLLNIAADRGLGPVTGEVRAQLDPLPAVLPDDVRDWPDACGGAVFRAAAGAAMADGSWIKRVAPAQEVAEFIAPMLAEVPDSDLATKLGQLRDWTG